MVTLWKSLMGQFDRPSCLHPFCHHPPANVFPLTSPSDTFPLSLSLLLPSPLSLSQSLLLPSPCHCQSCHYHYCHLSSCLHHSCRCHHCHLPPCHLPSGHIPPVTAIPFTFLPVISPPVTFLLSLSLLSPWLSLCYVSGFLIICLTSSS